MDFTLRIWRQASAEGTGLFRSYDIKGVHPDMTFLETLDVLNAELGLEGEDPIVFEADCLEGICGPCGFMIDGRSHAPAERVRLCRLLMREFEDGAVVRVEPFRSSAFPVLRDLVIDRRALERMIGGVGERGSQAESTPGVARSSAPARPQRAP